MKQWNTGNDRRPQPKDFKQQYLEYEVEMIKKNCNWDIVELEIPKILCIRNLANLRVEPSYDGPIWRADENAVAKTDGQDVPTCWDADIACYLIQEMKKNVTKQVIKVKLNKNVQAIMREAGVL